MKPPTESNSFEPPAKWRPHYRALLRVRETLLGETAEHEAALRATREKGGTDAVDVAETESEFGEHLALLQSEQAGLSEIEAALARIRAGTYGRCELTGEAISAERLRAVPWTRLSTAAARKTEENKKAPK
ncbi:MAG: ral stress protein [Verrucomicrobiota bacterium]|jgi:RNA polymerase-binding transcription factor DksA